MSICLHSRFPILLWWGPDLVMIYNDAYRPIGALSAAADRAAVMACWGTPVTRDGYRRRAIG